jgi:uncharacterized protein YjbI with pentapeptide repeats
MERTYIEDQDFDSFDFSKHKLAEAEYENCVFTVCNFSGVNLAKISFSECRFVDCNLSMVKLTGTTLRDIQFKGCKLMGLHFEDCSDFLFSVSFDNCLLNLSSFYRRNLKKTLFKNCNLQEVDFTEADLSIAQFDNCDLSKAVFRNTNLEKADFRSAYNYTINPEQNRIKKARFSLDGLTGLLHQYDIEIG